MTITEYQNKFIVETAPALEQQAKYFMAKNGLVEISPYLFKGMYIFHTDLSKEQLSNHSFIRKVKEAREAHEPDNRTTSVD